MRTTEEKNRMIAEFMGYSPETMNVNVVRPDGYTRAKNVTAYQIEPKRHDDLPNLTADYMLKYHTSWDWLMPVVEKIENTSVDNKDNSDNFFNVVIEAFECDINGGGNTIHANGHTKKEATYKAVVEFIEWYNENK